MKYRTRTYYTDAQKALMWERWRQGWTLHQIAHLFDRAHGSIRGIFERTGGFRPPQRSRSPIALTLAEGEEISRSVVEGESIRSTTARLGRAPSTISREIRRNGGQGNYRATEADHAAWDRALRPKCCKLARNRDLAQIVTGKLRLLWSPEQIAGWLKHAHPHDENHRGSHETIYRTLFIQTRGALKKELLQHLEAHPRHRMLAGVDSAFSERQSAMIVTTPGYSGLSLRREPISSALRAGYFHLLFAR